MKLAIVLTMVLTFAVSYFVQKAVNNIAHDAVAFGTNTR